MKIKIYKSKQTYGFIFVSGIICLVDGLIRVLSLGRLTTNFAYEHARSKLK